LMKKFGKKKDINDDGPGKWKKNSILQVPIKFCYWYCKFPSNFSKVSKFPYILR
jgi:hypothetical protein